jgi:hypothetical protein
MSRPTQVPLDRMAFPLTLRGELRATFADIVSSPLPRRLSALAPIECRFTTNAPKGTGPWGKRNRNIEPY